MLEKNYPIMVFDVESIGLHGEGFAVGYVVLVNGKEVECDLFACPPNRAIGRASDFRWVKENIPALSANSPDPFTIREKFFRCWEKWKAEGALLAADCGWPVEARFLCACVDALPEERRFAGPYPFMEISSVMIAAGLDPMKRYARRKNERPVHNPLADARQSARLLLKALTEYRKDYHELLFAVARGFPGETRHATALRYILEAERAEAAPCRMI